MNINKQAFELAGVTVEQYLEWCEKKHKAAYKPSTKRDFFARLNDGRLVKEYGTNKLLEKRPRKNKRVWR